jgi:hypothetical protein
LEGIVKVVKQRTYRYERVFEKEIEFSRVMVVFAIGSDKRENAGVVGRNELIKVSFGFFGSGPAVDDKVCGRGVREWWRRNGEGL